MATQWSAPSLQLPVLVGSSWQSGHCPAWPGLARPVPGPGREKVPPCVLFSSGVPLKAAILQPCKH